MDDWMKEVEGVLVVSPAGRLDTSNASDVDKTLVAKLTAGATRVVFDFQRTEYLSSAGLRSVLKAGKLARQNGGDLALCAANRNVMEVLELSGLSSTFQHLRNLDAAKAVV